MLSQRRYAVTGALFREAVLFNAFTLLPRLDIARLSTRASRGLVQ